MTAATSAPINFDLRTKDYEYVLYITDDLSIANLIFEIKNTQEKVTTFLDLPGEVSGKNHHLELVFRPGTLLEPGNINMLNDAFEWSEKQNPGGTHSLFFKAKNTLTLEKKESLTIELAKISAQAPGGTRGTRVLFRYSNLVHHESQQPFSGFSERKLSIINHRGKPTRPIHAGFLEGNKVLNNGEKNTLHIRVSNFLLEEKKPFNEKSQLVLELEGGEPDQFWTLATTEELKGIQVKYKYPGKQEVEVAPKQLTWRIPLLNPEKPKGEDDSVKFKWVDILVTGLETKHPNGFTRGLLFYENIPGFQDGHFELVVERSPVVFEDERVGIGKRPAGDLKLLVNEAAQIDEHLTVQGETDKNGSSNRISLNPSGPSAEGDNGNYYLDLRAYPGNIEDYIKIRFHQHKRYWAWLGYHGLKRGREGEFVFWDLNKPGPARLRTGPINAKGGIKCDVLKVPGSAKVQSLQVDGDITAAGLTLKGDSPKLIFKDSKGKPMGELSFTDHQLQLENASKKTKISLDNGGNCNIDCGATKMKITSDKVTIIQDYKHFELPIKQVDKHGPVWEIENGLVKDLGKLDPIKLWGNKSPIEPQPHPISSPKRSLASRIQAMSQSSKTVIPRIAKLDAYAVEWKGKKPGASEQVVLDPAQVEKQFPGLVEQIDDHKLVNYEKFVPILIEAIKEQQGMIEKLKRSIK